MNYIEYTMSGLPIQQLAKCGRIQVEHPLICGFELIEDSDMFSMVSRIRLYLKNAEDMLTEKQIKKDTKEFLWNLITEWVCRANPDQMEPIQLLTSQTVIDNLIVNANGIVIGCSTRYMLIQPERLMTDIVKVSTTRHKISPKLLEIMQMPETMLAYMALYEYLINLVPGRNQRELDTILRDAEFPLVKRKRNGKIVEETDATFLRNRIAHDIQALDPEIYKDIKAEVKTLYVKLLRVVLMMEKSV